MAFTEANHISFASGRYDPKSLGGRMLLAHELAHTIQQRGSRREAHQFSAKSTAHEAVANRAAAACALGAPARVSPDATAPRLQFAKVTTGGFGRALEEYTKLWSVPDTAINLLRRSRRFMTVARTLDQHFVWRDDSFLHEPLNYDANGRITNGPRSIRGKRELFVTRDTAGASFEPFESPDNILSGDVISLSGVDTATFIQEIAHEASHAVRFVTGSGPAPTTLAAAVNAGIQEEIDVRNDEAVILAQIPSSTLQQSFAPTGSTAPAQVQRDFAPGIGMTYLEAFFFDFRLRETQAAEGLNDDQAREVRERVNANVNTLHFRSQPSPTTGVLQLDQYASVWQDRIWVKREWAEFTRNNRPSDSGYAAAKERLLQDHARRFFGGRISYSSLRSPSTSPPTSPSPAPVP